MLGQIITSRVLSLLPSSLVGVPLPRYVRVEALDYGNQLGVAIELFDGRRHAVKVKIARNDLTKAADEAATALTDWLRHA